MTDSLHSDPLASLMAAWEADLMRGKRVAREGAPPWQPPNVYASRRRRCTLAMALDMLHPEDDPFNQPIQFERLRQGEEAENAIVARFHRIGQFASPAFKVEQQQHRFEIPDRDGVVLVTGKMDGRLRFHDGQAPPFEIKSGRTYEGCDSIEALDRSPWARSAVDQILAYLYADKPTNYANNEPWGFLFIKRQSRMPAPIRVNLLEHLGRVEAFLSQARQAVDYRHGRGPRPPYIDDPSECKKCGHFGKSCTPPLDYGGGVEVISDPELSEALDVRERCRPAHEAFEQADSYAKERLRGVESALVGNYLVKGTWGPSTVYKVPPEVKEKYREVVEKGRFTLKIEKL